MQKTVLVTGGTGKVGRLLILGLLERGYHVRALIHKTPLKNIDHPNIEMIKGSLDNPASLEKAVRGSQIICHLAAVFDLFPPVSLESDNDLIYRINTTGTFYLLEAARKIGNVEHFLFASTDAVYATGPRKFDRPITEETELVPSRFYSITKILGENLCIHYYKLYGLSYTIIRFGWTLSEDDVLRLFEFETWKEGIKDTDRDRLRSKLAHGKGVFAPLFENGESALDHVGFAPDAANSFVCAIEDPRSHGNTFNIVSSKPFRYLDVIERVADGLGVPWDKARVQGIEPYEISIEKARKLIGYEPKYDIETMIDLALEKQRNQ